MRAKTPLASKAPTGPDVITIWRLFVVVYAEFNTSLAIVYRVVVVRREEISRDIVVPEV